MLVQIQIKPCIEEAKHLSEVDILPAEQIITLREPEHDRKEFNNVTWFRTGYLVGIMPEFLQPRFKRRVRFLFEQIL